MPRSVATTHDSTGVCDTKVCDIQSVGTSTAIDPPFTLSPTMPRSVATTHDSTGEYDTEVCDTESVGTSTTLDPPFTMRPTMPRSVATTHDRDTDVQGNNDGGTRSTSALLW